MISDLTSVPLLLSIEEFAMPTAPHVSAFLRVTTFMTALVCLGLLGGCGGPAMEPREAQNLSQWKRDGLLAKHWAQSNRGWEWHMAWRRRSHDSGLVELYQLNGSKSDSVSPTEQAQLPADCFTLVRIEGGYAKLTATAKEVIGGVSELRILPSGRILLFGESYIAGFSSTQAALLDKNGNHLASWTPPKGGAGRVDFMGPFLVGYFTTDKQSEVVLLNPDTLNRVSPDLTFAVLTGRPFADGPKFKSLVVRDPTPGLVAAKALLTPTGPLELPFSADRLLPYEIGPEKIGPISPKWAGWNVSGWLVERGGKNIAVLDQQGALRAAGLSSAEPILVKARLHAVGAAASTPGILICDADQKWSVLWHDGVTASPLADNKAQALFAAESQRTSVNAASINENNRRAFAAIEADLARKAAARAEKARAEAQAQEYANILRTFNGHLERKDLNAAFAVIKTIDQDLMHQIMAKEWEDACVACAKVALQSTRSLDWISARALFFSFSYYPQSIYGEHATRLSDKSSSLIPVTPTIQSPSATSSSGNYVRELPGASMNQFLGRMKMELQAAGANYYDR